MSRKHWLAAYGERIPAEINPDAYELVVGMLEAAMKRYAEKRAFRCFGQTLTYADTDTLSRKFAAYGGDLWCVQAALLRLGLVEVGVTAMTVAGVTLLTGVASVSVGRLCGVGCEALSCAYGWRGRMLWGG